MDNDSVKSSVNYSKTIFQKKLRNIAGFEVSPIICRLLIRIHRNRIPSL